MRLRSSVAVKSPGESSLPHSVLLHVTRKVLNHHPIHSGGGSILNAMDEAEETGYQGSYFPIEQIDSENNGNNNNNNNANPQSAETTPLLDESDATPLPDPSSPSQILSLPTSPDLPSSPPSFPFPPSSKSTSEEEQFDASVSLRSKEPKLAEAIFFDYGVSVFLGFTEGREKDILSDCESGGSWNGAFGREGESAEERGWEMEECHFVVCSSILFLVLRIPYPDIDLMCQTV